MEASHSIVTVEAELGEGAWVRSQGEVVTARGSPNLFVSR